MTEHDMIGWFNAAPMGSRQQRMQWAAHKIARLTGATEGNVYQTLERSLERAGPPPSGSSVQRQRRVAPGRLGSLAISRSRQQDKLPTDRRRNASERRVDESSDGADGRPDLKKCDRLLRRLIAVHGEPRFDLFNSRPSKTDSEIRSETRQMSPAPNKESHPIHQTQELSRIGS